MQEKACKFWHRKEGNSILTTLNNTVEGKNSRKVFQMGLHNK